ncbi:MAG: hypothetical protein IT290_02680 [Deltaproteobacteria bacterium]|nr:hypothetical protein [Deltaproteobacteria bacterium]
MGDLPPALLLLFNPRSGRSRGRQIAHSVAEALGERGYHSHLIEAQAYARDATAFHVAHPHARAVVIGGDGTVRLLLPSLSAGQIPFCMFPAGNENLFARCFGMLGDTDSLAKCVASAPNGVKWGTANGQPFFTMVSVGLDANVVRSVSLAREQGAGKGSTRWSYIPATLHEFIRLSPRKLRITIDGIAREAEGVIVANSPYYGGGIFPAVSADPRSADFTCRLFPRADRSFYAKWLADIAFGSVKRNGNTLPSPDLIAGREVLIESLDGDCPTQADGDDSGNTPLRISISPSPLLVLGTFRSPTAP